jgi:VWFA-related protein
MLVRPLSILLSSFLVFSFALFAQTRGGGGRGTSATPTPQSTPPTHGTFKDFEGGVTTETADNEGKIEFRAETVLVQVPIVITDKSGNHIHNLPKESFHIYENGKEQKITSFEEIVSTTANLPVIAPRPGEFSNLTLSEQTPHAITVIVLDTVNTPLLDQSTGRRELVKYLANNLDATQVRALMIMTSHGLKIVQGLTGDPEQLVTVLKKASGEMPALQGVNIATQTDAALDDIPTAQTIMSQGADPRRMMDEFIERGDAIHAQFQQSNAIETTMNAFLGIAWYLSGVPGRKSVIWATGGFPFTIAYPAVVPGGYLSQLYERTMEALRAAQISVYPVDVRGLASNALPDASEGRKNTGPAATQHVTGQVSMQQITNRSWLQQSTVETLSEFAEMTGGRAFFNTNNLASSFKRADNDASSYYLAGYYLDKSNDRAGWRQLKVKVDKEDTEIRARKGFFVTNATIHLEQARGTDLTYALSSPIEGTGVPITMKWLTTSDSDDKKKTDFLVNVPLNGVSLQIRDGKNRINFDVAWAAFLNSSKKGEPAITSTKTVSAFITDANLVSLRANGIAMQDTLELGPGQYTVRVVVRDNVTGKVGSITAPLTVN